MWSFTSFSKSIALLTAAFSLVSPSPINDARASRFSFYDLPTPFSGPCDLCTGPDGALWGQDQLIDKLFRINTTTGAIEEYDIPWTNPPIIQSPGLNASAGVPRFGNRTVFACAIRPGADGNIYASNGIRNQLVQVNLTTKKVSVLTPTPYIPFGDLQPFNDLYTGPEGMYFTQTTDDLISYYEYSTGLFKSYKTPTLGSSPLGMFYASDGNAYAAEFLGNKIAQLNPRTGVITEFPLPPSLLGPAVIRVETEGKYIWFTSFLGNGLGRLNFKTGDVKAYTNPSPLSFPAEDTVDSEGRIWFSTATQATLNYFDPKSETFHTIRQPGVTVVAPVSVPFYFEIAMHYGPGNAIYWTEETVNCVGRYQLD